MALVDLNDLIEEAREGGYPLPLIEVTDLPALRGVLAAVEGADAPLVIAVHGAGRIEGLLPSVEAAARRSPMPLALLGTGIRSGDEVALAIRHGCNGLVLEPGGEGQGEATAASCGVPLIAPASLTWDGPSGGGQLVGLRGPLEEALLAAYGQPADGLAELHEAVVEAARGCVAEWLATVGAAGRGRMALVACRHWRPIEHLIIYQTNLDQAGAEALAAEGRRVLDLIPGVRATWSGRAVKEDARFPWCWLIRFAHPAVIDSYRDHPDHVAYANQHFRPAAADRISIDYELIGADELE